MEILILIAFIMGIFLGGHLVRNENLEITAEYLTTLDRCMAGWGSTLDTLKRANEALENK